MNLEKLLIEQRAANHIVWCAVATAAGALLHSVLAGALLALAVTIVKEFVVDDKPDAMDFVYGAVGVVLVAAGAHPGIVRVIFEGKP